MYIENGILYSGAKALIASDISFAANDPSGVMSPDSWERLRWYRSSVVSTTVALRTWRR